MRLGPAHPVPITLYHGERHPSFARGILFVRNNVEDPLRDNVLK